MDPIEKTMLVLPRLPSRPYVVEKRDGPGRRYCELRYWILDNGARVRKDGIYLGQLTPLQLVAARQVIDDAWPRRRNLRPKPDQDKLRSLRTDYRMARQRLTVLARRAGYHMHGFSMRRMTMTEEQTDGPEQDPAMLGSAGYAFIFEDSFNRVREEKKRYVDAFEHGLHIMQKVCTDLFSFYAGNMMDRIMPVPPEGTPLDQIPRVTNEEERAIATICRLNEAYIKLGEARLRLRGARPEGSVP